LLHRNDPILRPSGAEICRLPDEKLMTKAPAGAGIMAGFQVFESTTMDAEQINSISYKLDDIAQRAAELRRYL
jgi:hypothetical protein